MRICRVCSSRPSPASSMPGVVRDAGQVPHAALPDRLDQRLRDAAQAEPARHDHHAVPQHPGQRRRRVRIDLAHRHPSHPVSHCLVRQTLPHRARPGKPGRCPPSCYFTSTPCCRRKPSSGSSGRPRIASMLALHLVEQAGRPGPPGGRRRRRTGSPSPSSGQVVLQERVAERPHASGGVRRRGARPRARPRRQTTAVTRRCGWPRSARSCARAPSMPSGLSNQASLRRPGSGRRRSPGRRDRAPAAAFSAGQRQRGLGGVCALRPPGLLHRRLVHPGRPRLEHAARPPPAAPPARSDWLARTKGGAPACIIGACIMAWAAAAWAGWGRTTPPLPRRRRSCQASISCSTVAAVSSMERRVTSITGQPRRVHSRRAHSSSAAHRLHVDIVRWRPAVPARCRCRRRSASAGAA